MNVRARVWILLVPLALISACRALAPSGQAPEPALELIEAAPLSMAEGCGAGGSYIVDFIVDTQGRTTDIRAPIAPPCVQNALTAWAASFRYSPPAVATPSSVEWLLVSAKRGT